MFKALPKRTAILVTAFLTATIWNCFTPVGDRRLKLGVDVESLPNLTLTVVATILDLILSALT